MLAVGSGPALARAISCGGRGTGWPSGPAIQTSRCPVSLIVPGGAAALASARSATAVTAAAAGAAMKLPRAWIASAGLWLAASVNCAGRAGGFGGIGTAAVRRTGFG